jgi:tRNA pseudouridine32 synthase/23S rRNA pseudouridine746 synthase
MINILFENKDFVLCDKPSGVLSTPSRIKDDRFCLGTELEKHLGLQIFPVHRLDFEVSGLVLYAKNSDSHRASNSWFENRLVHKTYCTLSTAQNFDHIPANIPNTRAAIDLGTQQEFVWKAMMLRGKKRTYESPQGKPSVTQAYFLGVQDAGYLRWDLQPITGRSHQLRFDMSRHGFPILGDELYGSRVKLDGNTIALRSYRIDFSKCPDAKRFGLPEKFEAPVDEAVWLK